MKILDKDLGEIRLIKSSRAKRIIARYRDDGLQLTYPSDLDLPFVKKTIEDMKPRLLKLIDNRPKQLIFTPETKFSTLSFDLKFVESSATKNFYITLKDRLLIISYPPKTIFENDLVQKTIRSLILAALRFEANKIFQKRVKILANRFKFNYNSVKISKSMGRWGSCSSKGDINLSCYLMLLPLHLVDFVILHELCHTKEMNHGNNFWKLLDSVTGDNAKGLTQELNKYKINW